MAELFAATMSSKERVKYFNQIFTTILNKFQSEAKPTQDLQIKVYANSLLASISMFVKRATKPTLDENFEEAKIIKFQMKGCKEGQVSLFKKEVQPPTRRGLLLTRPSGKQTKQSPKKGSGDIEGLQHMVKKLSNKIIDMKRSAREGNQGQRPYNRFFKRNLPFKAIKPPPTNLNIDLGNVDSDSFCTYHQENQSERDYPQWVHAMNLMANRFLDEVSLTEQSSGSTINIFDQEEADPLEETTMLIWDVGLPMPSDDLSEVQEPPTEVLAMQTQSRGQHVSNDLTTTQTSRGKPALNHPKAPFSPRINPIKIHTRESPKLHYNIVEDLKRLKENISVMDMCRIPWQKDFLLQELRSVENPMTSIDQGENITPIDLRNKPTMNASSKDKKGKHFVSPFLLMFEVFNRNLHNCLVDSGASSNVIPLSI
jgi:hypothetical protein